MRPLVLLLPLAAGLELICPTDEDLRRAAVPRLGVLAARGDDAAWDAYLDRVYGALPEAAYPVDLDSYEWFYDEAPIRVHVAQVDPRCVVPRNTAWTGPAPPRGHFPEWVATSLAKGFFVQRWAANDPAPAPAAPGSWIEIVHAARSKRIKNIFELAGACFIPRPEECKFSRYLVLQGAGLGRLAPGRQSFADSRGPGGLLEQGRRLAPRSASSRRGHGAGSALVEEQRRPKALPALRGD